MQGDRRRRARKAGEDIEELVEADNTREAWSKIQRWYCKAKVHSSPPTREVLEHTSTLREDIYRRHPLEGEAILILVLPVSIVYRHPEGEEISVAVPRLRMVHMGGPSRIREEHLNV